MLSASLHYLLAQAYGSADLPGVIEKTVKYTQVLKRSYPGLSSISSLCLPAYIPWKMPVTHLLLSLKVHNPEVNFNTSLCHLLLHRILWSCCSNVFFYKIKSSPENHDRFSQFSIKPRVFWAAGPPRWIQPAEGSRLSRQCTESKRMWPSLVITANACSNPKHWKFCHQFHTSSSF